MKVKENGGKGSSLTSPHPSPSPQYPDLYELRPTGLKAVPKYIISSHYIKACFTPAPAIRVDKRLVFTSCAQRKGSGERLACRRSPFPTPSPFPSAQREVAACDQVPPCDIHEAPAANPNSSGMVWERPDMGTPCVLAPVLGHLEHPTKSSGLGASLRKSKLFFQSINSSLHIFFYLFLFVCFYRASFSTPINQELSRGLVFSLLHPCSFNSSLKTLFAGNALLAFYYRRTV